MPSRLSLPLPLTCSCSYLPRRNFIGVLVGEAIFSWRFFLSVGVAAIAIVGIYWAVDDHLIRLIISIPVAIAGIVGGFVWQWRND